MRKIITAALLALPLAASAQEPTITFVYDIAVQDSLVGGMFFGMSSGSCLRGPAVFKGRDGADILRAAAGVEVGSGCFLSTLGMTFTIVPEK